ncbi:unnamed protein product [Staurois parvus]|uniref:Uncharacterized protein n=1 Tax=Staurois parvus TaxID=386267 RepID=A0ABN9DW67_9NEOB|nr:unnamed protein product [Staurois parvus]
MGPPTDPGPSGSARLPKWSVRPWLEGSSCLSPCLYLVPTHATIK